MTHPEAHQIDYSLSREPQSPHELVSEVLALVTELNDVRAIDVLTNLLAVVKTGSKEPALSSEERMTLEAYTDKARVTASFYKSGEVPVQQN